MINNLKTHVGYVILIVVAVAASFLVFTTWRAEHDARLVAEVQIKASEEKVKTLQQEMKDRDAIAQTAIDALKKRATQVKTPEAAAAAIPEVANPAFPLNLRMVPGDVGRATVDVMPLYQTLNECRQNAIELGACRADKITLNGVVKEKSDQIADLKKKPSFFKRLGKSLKDGGVAIVLWEIVKIAVTKKP